VRHEALAEHAGGRLDLLVRARELHAAGLAAPAGVHLRLDDPQRTAERFGCRFRFLRTARDPAFGHGDPVFGKQCLRLVFVEVQERSWPARGARYFPRNPGAAQNRGPAGRSLSAIMTGRIPWISPIKVRPMSMPERAISPESEIQSLVARARAAQAIFEGFTQEQVDAIVRDIGKYVYDNAENSRAWRSRRAASARTKTRSSRTRARPGSSGTT
jgi:hypothetical protein